MDDFDDERFSRQFLPSAPAARHAHPSAPPAEQVGRARVEGGRQEQPLGAEGEPSAVRVRGLDAAERERVQDEMQLLASLEIDQITAAPAVLELEEDGYLREAAPAIRHHSGRRAAEAAAPSTGERHALASARQALDTLIDALHEQEWVLGAQTGGGLGVRADGTVVVLDLRGLRRDQSLAARQGDRRWVDSVLQDQDRTLRRRVHLAPPRDEAAASPVGSPAEPPAAPPALPTPRRMRRRRDSLGAADRAPEAHGTRAEGESTLLDPVREVLRQPRLRGIALLSGALVLLVCAGIGAGTWRMQQHDATAAEQPPAAPAAPGEDAARPAPGIEDPQMLVAELAGARHAYVTGLSSQPVSAPGSPALAEDDAVRAAYSRFTVVSGGPVIHSAEVLVPPDEEGIAVLRAVTSTEELELEDRTGEVTTVPATSPVTVRLELRWNGEQWRILSVTPAETPQDTAD